MATQLAHRTNVMRASEIRELLKLTERPEVISLAGGLPAPELFPVAELIAASTMVLANEGCQALQYSTTEGHVPLRGIIAARMRDRLGCQVDAANVLITSGSQQGLDLVGKILLDPGDVVLCESPTYVGAINAFNAYEPRFVEVPTDDDGMIIEELEARLLAEPRAKLIYVVPDFQNPSGRCWTLARRQALLDLARRFAVLVVEDAPYAELRFEGEPIPPLRALDAGGGVLFLGTFSKVFCPGLRLGWLVAEPSLYEVLVRAKQAVDLHTPTLAQRQLRAYLEHNDIDANIARIRSVYRRRRDAMVDAIERYFPAGVAHTSPAGGLFLWLELPAAINARELLAACITHNVAFVPGGGFFPNGGHENTCRLNFSAVSEERIEEGIRRMGRALSELMHAQPGPAPLRAVVGAATARGVLR
jgi:2-aminoadipate transaminase